MLGCLKRFMFGIACTSALISQAGAEDWSGWWGGLSIGGAHTGFDARRISDGSQFCVTETSGDASASCSFGLGIAEANTEVYLDDASLVGRYAYDNGSVSASSSGANLDPPVDDSVNLTGGGDFPNDIVFVSSRASLSSPDGASSGGAVAAINMFDFGTIPDLNSGSFALGGHIRRDWQTEKGWIFGVEGELVALFGSGDDWFAEDDFQIDDGVQAFATQSVSVKARGLGSLRVRLGRDMGSWMPYVTGGLGIGWFKAGLSKSFEELNFVRGSLSSNETAREVLYGGVIGGGVQHRLNEVTTLSGEVLYYHFNGQMNFDHDQSVGVDDAVSVMFKLSRKLN